MQILENQILANYTTTKVGGRVRWMFFPENSSDLIESIKFATHNRFPFFILAGGSNTIFEDKNLLFRQVVINLTKFNSFQILEQQNFDIIEASPGLKLQKLVDLAQSHHLKGVSNLNRIPGTVGGAVLGNAGAYGTETSTVVEEVEYIDINELVSKLLLNENLGGNIFHKLNKQECEFGYRFSFFKGKGGLIITKIRFKLAKENNFEEEYLNYQKIAKIRDSVYPVGFVSPGSVFKNILIKDLSEKILLNIPNEWIVYNEKIPVAKLLESVDSKNLRFGAISMRETHANIMINHGGAEFSDVKNLINELQKRVKEKFDIDIEPEIRLVTSDFSKFKH